MESKNINFIIPVSLHQQFKQLSLNTGKKLGFLFIQAITDFLDREKSKERSDK